MLKKIIKTYYKLLDEKLENGTMVVLLIAFLIISASLIIKETNANLLVKNNVIESSINMQTNNTIIEINGIKYEIFIKELQK